MFKKFIFFFILFLLSNCSAPTSASLLGPLFTASKTGSIYQASLSYGSGEMLNKIKKDFEESKSKLENKSKILLKKIRIKDIKPPILLSLKTEAIEISNIFEIEHLP